MDMTEKSGDGFCDNCGTVFDLLEFHRAAYHQGTEENRCTICGKLYLKPSKVIKHVLKHESNMLKCHVCSKEEFDEFEMLFRHLEEHLQLHIYLCVLCSKTFAVRDHYEDHMLAHSSPWNRSLLDCLNCDLRFDAQRGGMKKLKRHWLNRHCKHFKCSLCNKKFNNFTTFYSHGMRHRRQLPYSCDECGLGFRKKCRLDEHVKTNHCNKFSFTCDICSLKFKYKPSFDAHLRSHDENLRFSCNYCGKLFIRKVSLLDHFVEKECTQCDMQFHCRTLFDVHFKNYHRLDRMFACDECPKTYIFENGLKRHKTLAHVKPGENVYKCYLCAYETITRHNLNRHKRRNHRGADALKASHKKGIVKSKNQNAHLKTNLRTNKIENGLTNVDSELVLQSKINNILA